MRAHLSLKRSLHGHALMMWVQCACNLPKQWAAQLIEQDWNSLVRSVPERALQGHKASRAVPRQNHERLVVEYVLDRLVADARDSVPPKDQRFENAGLGLGSERNAMLLTEVTAKSLECVLAAQTRLLVCFHSKLGALPDGYPERVRAIVSRQVSDHVVHIEQIVRPKSRSAHHSIRQWPPAPVDRVLRLEMRDLHPGRARHTACQ
mmetsp:Transcript_23542/g.66916  ORF Transcript_23542/g.66916 Transcript_23542/m.66916 type:complete len:206 (-) Transcript_23542:737-1354(-)